VENSSVKTGIKGEDSSLEVSGPSRKDGTSGEESMPGEGSAAGEDAASRASATHERQM